MSVKARESPNLGVKAHVEWNQGEEPGGGEGPGGPGQMVAVQGRKKNEIPCSGHPLQQRPARRKSSKALGGAGADKCRGLTEARALARGFS